MCITDLTFKRREDAVMAERPQMTVKPPQPQSTTVSDAYKSTTERRLRNRRLMELAGLGRVDILRTSVRRGDDGER